MGALAREIRQYLGAAVAHHKRYASKVLEPFARYAPSRPGRARGERRLRRA